MNERKLSRISAALQESVKKDCKNDVTISFSGGIDSTLIAFLAKKYKNVELIAVGVKNSYDIEAAKSAAKLINLDLTVKEISDDYLVSEALILQLFRVSRPQVSADQPASRKYGRTLPN